MDLDGALFLDVTLRAPDLTEREPGSDSETASPSNTPGGFALWELKSTNCPLLQNAHPHNAGWHYAALRNRHAGVGNR